MIPGELIPAAGEIELNAGRPTVTLTVANTGDRPIQVGSHYHFFETNAALAFDRDQARGMRLDIPAGTAVRFEPGPVARGDAGGLRRRAQGLRLQPEDHGGALMAFRMSRAAYAHMFGPTVGDKVRLADTDLVIEVEEDRTVYGEEVKFGGGKVIRDGMGQGQETRSAGAVDTVITNALILDHWGIVKADIGLKDGRIAAIGKAGNPETQPGRRHRHRPRHRGDRRRGQDPHRRRDRRPHPLHLPADPRRGAGDRPHHAVRRRHRPGRGHHRHHLHARRLAHRPDAAGAGGLADQCRPAGQGQCQPARGAARAGRGRRLRAQAARGLGHDAGRDRLLPRASPTRWTCRWRSTPTR